MYIFENVVKFTLACALITTNGPGTSLCKTRVPASYTEQANLYSINPDAEELVAAFYSNIHNEATVVVTNSKRTTNLILECSLDSEISDKKIEVSDLKDCQIVPNSEIIATEENIAQVNASVRGEFIRSYNERYGAGFSHAEMVSSALVGSLFTSLVTVGAMSVVGPPAKMNSIETGKMARKAVGFTALLSFAIGYGSLLYLNSQVKMSVEDAAQNYVKDVPDLSAAQKILIEDLWNGPDGLYVVLKRAIVRSFQKMNEA